MPAPDPAAAGTESAPWTGHGRIAGAADVERALVAVNAAGQRRAQTAAMAQPVQRAADVALDAPDLARTLPVLPEIAEVLSLNWSARSFQPHTKLQTS